MLLYIFCANLSSRAISERWKKDISAKTIAEMTYLDGQKTKKHHFFRRSLFPTFTTNQGFCKKKTLKLC